MEWNGDDAAPLRPRWERVAGGWYGLAAGAILAAGALAFHRAASDTFDLPKAAALETAVALLTVLTLLLRRPERSGMVPAAAILGALAAWALISSAFSWNWIISAKKSVIYVLWAAAFLLPSLIGGHRNVRGLLLAFHIAGLAAASLGILQWLETRGVSLPILSEGLLALPQTDRPGSFFGHVNAAAQFVLVTLPLGLAAVAGSRTRTLLVLPGTLAMVFFIVLSGTRAAWAGALAGAALLGAGWLAMAPAGRRRRRALLIAAAPFVLAGSFAILDLVVVVKGRGELGDQRLSERLRQVLDPRSTTVRERLDLFANTAAIIRDHPVLGVGAGGFHAAYPEYARAERIHVPGRLTQSRQPERTHNDLLQTAAETGIPGAALLLIAVLLALAPVLRLARAGSAGPGMLFCASAVAAMAVESLADFPFQQAAPSFAFWTAAGTLRVLAPGFTVASPVPGRGPGRPLALAGLSALALAVALDGGSRIAASREHAAGMRAFYGAGLLFSDDPSRSVAARTEALRRADRAAALDPRAFRHPLLQATILAALDRLPEAEAAYDRLLGLHPDLTKGLIGLGLLLRREGRPDEAFTKLNRAVRLNPDDPEPRVALAAILVERGEPRAAAAECRQALAVRPDLHEAHLVLSEIASLGGDHRAALLHARRALDLASGDRAARIREARVLEASLGPASAETLGAWRRVLDVDPGAVEPAIALAEDALRRASSPAELEPVLASLDPLLAAAPGARAIHLKAVCLDRLGRTREALVWYRHLVSLAHRDPGAATHIAPAIAAIEALRKRIEAGEEATSGAAESR